MIALDERLREWARRKPTAACIVDADARVWSYGEMSATVDALAWALAGAGVGVGVGAGAGAGASARTPAGAGGLPRAVIAITLPSGGALWAACLATTRAGYDALMLPESPRAQLRARVSAEVAPVLTIDAATFAALLQSANRCEPNGAQPHGGVILVSSGTTGRSRFVRKHAQTVDDVAAGLVAQGLFQEGDVVGSFLPAHHAYGFEHGFTAPLFAGATVAQHAAFSLPVAERLLGGGATVLPLVPATLSALVNSDVAAGKHAPRCVVSAGAPLSAGVRQSFRRKFGVEPIDLYGATELGTIWLDRGHGGEPVPGVEVRVVECAQRGALVDVAAGATGEIAVRSATRFDRLVGADLGAERCAAQEELLDGFFRTGDLGVVDENGTWRVTGRSKLIFDVAGLKVNPFEVEAAIESHAEVRAALVEPVRVGDGSCRVAARVERRNASATVSGPALREFLRGLLPDHAIPRAIEFVDQLPRSASGKVLRDAKVVSESVRQQGAGAHDPSEAPSQVQSHVPSQPPSRAPVVARPDSLKERSAREEWTRGLFDSSAEGYDASSGAAFLGSGRWYRRRKLGSAGLAQGMSMLDVGSGTGLCAWIAQQIVGESGRVVALDPSPGMLNVAHQRGVRETVVGRAELLPFADRSFDMVSMSYMLRHVDNLDAAFAEAHRVLRPGGRIVVFEVSTPPSRLARPVFRLAMRHALPCVGVLTSGRLSTYPMMRYWADTIEAAVGPDAIIAALERTGFRGARHQRELGVFSCYRGVVVAT